MKSFNTMKYPDVSSLMSLQNNNSSSNINSCHPFESASSKPKRVSKNVERDNSDSGNQPVVCKWEDCMIVFLNSELLYRHVCDSHAIKHKTKDQEYTCKWGACKSLSTKKREHLISHLMVHIPMKKFKCVTCSKKFKRSHDLKKHIKIHLKQKNSDELISPNNHSTVGSLESTGSQNSSLIHEQYVQNEYKNFNPTYYNQAEYNNLNPSIYHQLNDFKNNSVQLNYPYNYQQQLHDQQVLYEPPKDIVEDLFSQFQDLKSKYYQTLQASSNEFALLPQYPSFTQDFYPTYETTLNNRNQQSTTGVSNLELHDQDLQQKYHYQQYSMFNMQKNISEPQGSLTSCNDLDNKQKFSNDQQSSKDGAVSANIDQMINFITKNILTSHVVLESIEMDEDEIEQVVEMSKQSKHNLQSLVQYLNLCL